MTFITSFVDGVSEGQFQQVLDQELVALKSRYLSLSIDSQFTNVVFVVPRGLRRSEHQAQNHLYCRWKASPYKVYIVLLFERILRLSKSSRFFPTNKADADVSGNCPAGTVVDREIGHPTDLDFYLQSHGGLLGTSRPAHYSVCKKKL